MTRFTVCSDRIHAVVKFADPMNRAAANSRPGNSRRARRGLTLFEVVISLGILLGALAAVSQLISIGSRAAVQSQVRTQAILRCESKLSEILASAEMMQAVEDMPFEDQEPGWAWSLYVAEGPHIDLLELEVTVTHTGQNRLATGHIR